MAGTALGGVFDYFLANMPARMAALPALGVTIDTDVNVVDTYTDRWPIDGCPLFCIGANFPTATDAGEGLRAYVEIGGQGVEEDFNVPWYAACGRADGNQKLTRDAAIAVYDQVCTLLAADLSLGGLLRDGRWAEIGPLSATATKIQASNGTVRWFVISSTVHAMNHYYPGAP